ncbi:flavodoxin domain-containing protein [Thalassotalea agarivorans]|uniref:MioC protein n=1 Tax=Thalassotalea agarivorans TaxID=349064 RepID=A0A1I0GCK6_THASX|nr:flavodoxin domain-containing protein [Thalassotalea agarivorans]SET68510.1 MioC protein [Thalassotalea agarivorans]
MAIQIIVGSMLGNTEYVAEACQSVFETHSLETQLHFSPAFEDIISDKQCWLLCTSTHGNGDFPENIEQFVEDLTHSEEPLADLNFAVVAIGDSNYDTFCHAGKNLEKLLLSKGCKKITDTLLLDMAEDIDPEALAETWLAQHIDLFK